MERSRVELGAAVALVLVALAALGTSSAPRAVRRDPFGWVAAELPADAPRVSFALISPPGPVEAEAELLAMEASEALIPRYVDPGLAHEWLVVAVSPRLPADAPISIPGRVVVAERREPVRVLLMRRGAPSAGPRGQPR